MTPERPAAPVGHGVVEPMSADQARLAVATRTAELTRRLDAAAGARAQLAAVRARATSADGIVEVEVSARGTLLDLQLAAGASVLPPDRLAALVLRTVRTATAEAAQQVRAVLEPAVAPGTNLDDLVLDPAAPVGHADEPGPVHRPGPADEDADEPATWLLPADARAVR